MLKERDREGELGELEGRDDKDCSSEIKIQITSSKVVVVKRGAAFEQSLHVVLVRLMANEFGLGSLDLNLVCGMLGWCSGWDCASKVQKYITCFDMPRPQIQRTLICIRLVWFHAFRASSQLGCPGYLSREYLSSSSTPHLFFPLYSQVRDHLKIDCTTKDL